MRVLVETVDGTDYLEIILDEEDMLKLPSFGVIQEFFEGFRKRIPINIYIRVQTEDESYYLESLYQDNENNKPDEDEPKEISLD